MTFDKFGRWVLIMSIYSAVLCIGMLLFKHNGLTFDISTYSFGVFGGVLYDRLWKGLMR